MKIFLHILNEAGRIVLLIAIVFVALSVYQHRFADNRPAPKSEAEKKEERRVDKLQSIQERLIFKQKIKDLQEQAKTWPAIESDKWYIIREFEFNDADGNGHLMFDPPNVFIFLGSDILSPWMKPHSDGMSSACHQYLFGPYDNINDAKLIIAKSFEKMLVKFGP